MVAPAWRLLVGDARERLAGLEAGSVHTVVTSPPYFGLRDYGTDGQIGLEPTPDEFVAALVDVFRGVRRVLRDDGTCWLNLGDSYATQASGNSQRYFNGQGWAGDRGGAASARRGDSSRRDRVPDGWKPKDLLGIPWMVAFALRADGWYLRSDIVWSKPNPMPESVTDRPTKAHEYVFLLSKAPRYYFDADAIREDHAASTEARALNGYAHGGTNAPDRNDAGHVSRPFEAHGRNKRSVWTVATQPYAGAHFATFPPKLIEPCIQAGAPERACGECGAPWVRVVEKGYVRASGGSYGGRTHEATIGEKRSGHLANEALNVTVKTLGFKPSCSHDDGSARGVVLDPFTGAGTTGLVALQHRREFVGIELSAEYAAMARDRIETAIRLGFRAPERGPEVLADQAALFEL